MKLSTTFLILAVALTRAIAAPHRLQVREYDALEVRNPTDNSEHGQIHQGPQLKPYVHPLDHHKESYHMGTADNIKAAELSYNLAKAASSRRDNISAHSHTADAHTFSAHAALSLGQALTAQTEFKYAAKSHKVLSEMYANKRDHQQAADRMVAHHMSLHEAARMVGNHEDMTDNMGQAHRWAAEAKTHAGNTSAASGNTSAALGHMWEAYQHNAEAARFEAEQERRLRQAEDNQNGNA